MKFTIRILFFIFCAFPMALAYRLPGWELPVRLTNAGQALTADNRFFLQAEILRGRTLVFFTGARQLKAAVVSSGAQPGIETVLDVAPVDEGTVPVVRRDGASLLVLVYHSGEYRVLRMNNADSVQEIARFAHPVGYNGDLSVIGRDFAVSVPTVVQGRHNVEIIVFEKQGLTYRRRTYALPPLTENEKGNFFFRAVTGRSGTRCFFVKRSYDTARRQIGDYLYAFAIRTPDQIRSARPEMLLPFGYSDHPPDIIRASRQDWILLSRKRGSAYSLKLLPEGGKLEYSVSRDSVNAFSPAFIETNDILDLFFLGRNAEGTRLYTRSVDLRRLDEPGYLDIKTADRAVSAPGEAVSAVSVCSDGTNGTLCTVSEKDGAIRMSRTDRSVPPVTVVQERRIEDGINHPVLSWKEPDDPSGIAGYAVRVDTRPDSFPDAVNLKPEERVWDSRGLKTGNYTLHIFAVDSRGNRGPVRHVPFRVGAEVFQGFLSMQNRRLSKVEETLTLLEENLALSNDYRTARYAALLNYYRSAEQAFDRNDVPMAVHAISRSALIDPSRFETALYLTLAEKKKSGLFARFDVVILVGIYLAVILVLAGVYVAVNR